MFKADRIYSLKNAQTGKLNWFFQAREGDSGPYETKQEAEIMLKEYIEECIETGNAGGRNKDEPQQKFATFDPNSVNKPRFRYPGKRKWFG